MENNNLITSDGFERFETKKGSVFRGKKYGNDILFIIGRIDYKGDEISGLNPGEKATILSDAYGFLKIKIESEIVVSTVPLCAKEIDGEYKFIALRDHPSSHDEWIVKA